MIQILMKLLHQIFARALKIKDHSKRPTQKKVIYWTTDYGHMKAKSLNLCGTNSNSNPKKIFGMWT